jgi:multidrug efflux pump subunit AcrA (membrane-fusion protein)
VPAEVVVTTAAIPAATVVPGTALFQDASTDAWYVFVAGIDARAHRTPVTRGIRSGQLVQILTGVTPGQVVITSGGYALADGLHVQVTL